MATNEGNEDKSSKMFREAIRCFNGTVDFVELARRLDVPNAEAMRKRFKRAFEKDPEGPINVKGNQIGDSPLAGTPQAKGQRTPKTPGGRKRKADEIKDGAENIADEQIMEPNDDNGTASTSNFDLKPPQTPKTPKSQGRARAKNSAAPKSAKGKKATEDKNAKMNGIDADKEVNSAEATEDNHKESDDDGELGPSTKKQKVEEIENQGGDTEALLELIKVATGEV